MRAFLLMPRKGGMKEVAIDLDAPDLDRQLKDLQRLSELHAPLPAPSLDDQVEKLSDAHFEMVEAFVAGASGGLPQVAAGVAKKAKG